MKTTNESPSNDRIITAISELVHNQISPFLIGGIPEKIPICGILEAFITVCRGLDLDDEEVETWLEVALSIWKERKYSNKDERGY